MINWAVVVLNVAGNARNAREEEGRMKKQEEQ